MEFLYPHSCPVCGSPIPYNRTYCVCSDLAPRFVRAEDCEKAAADDLLDPFAAVYYYSGRVRADLLSFKFQRQASFAKPFGRAMAHQAAARFCGVLFDCVTFVPMTPDDLRERSFNQSALLAQWVARTFFIPCSALLKKTRATPSQHSLHQADRLNNLQNAFAPTDLVRPGSTVLLCDDIKTTGTTLRRCRETLLNAGVGQVYCVVCAMSDFSSAAF